MYITFRCTGKPKNLYNSCNIHLLCWSRAESVISLRFVCTKKVQRVLYGLPRWLSGKESLPSSAGDARDEGSIPGSGRSPGKGNGNPLQYHCLENPMDRRIWWAPVCRVTKTRTGLRNSAQSLFYTRAHLSLHSHIANV